MWTKPPFAGTCIDTSASLGTSRFFLVILSIRAVAPALALGNAVLLKPDLRTTVCGGVSVIRIFEEAGLPPGLLSLLPGGAEVGAAVVEAAVRSGTPFRIEDRVEALNEALTRGAQAGGPPIVQRKTPDTSPYTGSEVCSACHAEQALQWSRTPHAKALSSLAADNHATDAACVGCHVTGWHQEGGPSSPADIGGFRDVQCEACHGPGDLHRRSTAKRLEAMERLLERLRARLDRLPCSDEPQLLSLVAAAQVYLRMPTEDPEVAKLITALLGDPRRLITTEDLPEVGRVFLDLFGTLIDMFDAAQRESVLDPGNARERAVVFWSGLQGIAQLDKMTRIAPGFFDIEPMGMELCHNLLRG